MASVEQNKTIQEDMALAETLLESGESIALKVVSSNRGGLLVKLGRLSGFIPNSSITAVNSLPNRKNLADRKKNMIGTELALKVIEIDRGRPSVIFAPLDGGDIPEPEEPEVEAYPQGKVLKGTVTKIADDGVFVKLPSGSGFVPKEELAWRWLRSPKDFVKTGQEIEVMVLAGAEERRDLQLSRKELIANPWTTFSRYHKVGDLVAGRILELRPEGLLVQVAAGVHGMVRRQDINIPQAKRLDEIVLPGDYISVRIAALDAENEILRIKMWWSGK